jgi:hypothetical protein
VLSQKKGFSKYISAASYNNYEIKYLTLYDLKDVNVYEDDMKLVDIIKINEVHFVSTKNNHYLKYAYQTIKFDVKNKDVSYKEIQDVNQKSKYFCRLPSDNYFSYSSFLEIAMPIEEYDDYSIIEINADSQQLLNNFVKAGEDNDFDTLIFVLNECNVEGTIINDLSSIFNDNMNIKINYQKFISLYFGV